MPIFKITEEAAEEIKDSVQSLINATTRKTFHYFPPDIRRKHGLDDVRISTRFVKPPHGHDIFVFGLRFHRTRRFSFTIILLRTNNCAAIKIIRSSAHKIPWARPVLRHRALRSRGTDLKFHRLVNPRGPQPTAGFLPSNRRPRSTRFFVAASTRANVLWRDH